MASRFGRVYSVVALRSGTSLPDLAVTPEGYFGRLAGRLTNRDIELESENFNRAFTVTCPDRKFAFDVLHPRLMEKLLGYRDLSFALPTALVLLVVLPLVALVVMYNRFVRQRTLVDESWSQIDVELQRRHDLIPQLVTVVRAYAEHERAVLEQLTRAREAATAHRSGWLRRSASPVVSSSS